MRQKSKKEQAWDWERMKYRRKIKILEEEVARQIEANEAHLREIESLKDWNRRLLEYMDLPEDVMRDTIEREKRASEDEKALANIMKPFEASCEILFPKGMDGLIKFLSGGK